MERTGRSFLASSLIASARIRSLDEETNKTEEIAQVTKGINAIIGNRFVILLMFFILVDKYACTLALFVQVNWK